jgi:hypothetical protein
LTEHQRMSAGLEVSASQKWPNRASTRHPTAELEVAEEAALTEEKRHTRENPEPGRQAPAVSTLNSTGAPAPEGADRPLPEDNGRWRKSEKQDRPGFAGRPRGRILLRRRCPSLCKCHQDRDQLTGSADDYRQTQPTWSELNLPHFLKRNEATKLKRLSAPLTWGNGCLGKRTI